MALDFCDFELEGRGLARSVRSRKSACSPGRPYTNPANAISANGLQKVFVLTLTTMDLSQVRQLTERLCITQWNIGDSVVGQSRHGCYSSRLLSSSVTCRRDKDTSKLSI